MAAGRTTPAASSRSRADARASPARASPRTAISSRSSRRFAACDECCAATASAPPFEPGAVISSSASSARGSPRLAMCPSDCGRSSSARSSSGTESDAGGADSKRSRPSVVSPPPRYPRNATTLSRRREGGIGQQPQQRGHSLDADALVRDLGGDAVVVGVERLPANRLEVSRLRAGRLGRRPQQRVRRQLRRRARVLRASQSRSSPEWGAAIQSARRQVGLVATPTTSVK